MPAGLVSAPPPPPPLKLTMTPGVYSPRARRPCGFVAFVVLGFLRGKARSASSRSALLDAQHLSVLPQIDDVADALAVGVDSVVDHLPTRLRVIVADARDRADIG